MCKWKTVKIKKVKEEDGILHVMETSKEVPFDIRRIFLISQVAEGKTRGNHATKKTRLILFPVAGSCMVVVNDGNFEESILLDDPSTGLLIEPMVWRSMQEFTPDCVMMAVCDRLFDSGNETYDDFDEYLRALKSQGEERK